MTTIRTRVLPGGRIEITDPALREGAEVVVVVGALEGDGASGEVLAPAARGAPGTQALTPEAMLGGLPLVDENGKPVFLPPSPPPREGYSLVDMIGAAPSGRTAEEVDRELRELRSE